MEIAVSSVAFKGLSIEGIVMLAKHHDLYIEFSSGLPYQSNALELYQNSTIRRVPHNYFPAPEQPFVLNLASLDAKILERSIDHCIQGINLARSSQAPMYSVHAGFCADPNHERLGGDWGIKNGFERDRHWVVFLESIAKILVHAREAKIQLLIENNVLTQANFEGFDQVPFFCCSPDEIVELNQQITDPSFGLLLDTAHLKVAAGTLGFDLNKALFSIKPYIKAIHHSDNDGLSDTNQPISSDYWFGPQMRYFKKALHVLEVKNLTLDQVKEQVGLLHEFLKQNKK